MGRNWDKFLLLMWKNWMTQIRKPVQTIIEIAAPIFFSVLLVIIRSLSNPELHGDTLFSPYDLITENTTQLLSSNISVLYSPFILEKIFHDLNDIPIKTQGFNTAADLEKFYLDYPNSVFAAVQLPDDAKDITSDSTITIRFPSELKIEKNGIDSWKTNLMYPMFQTAGPRDYEHSNGAVPYYNDEGFLPFQYIVTKLFHNYISPGQPLDLNDIVMQRFPYGEWQEDVLLQVLSNMAGILVLLSLVYTCTNTVKSITIEKEKQLKETMKIMGLPNWLHWLAWFIKCFSFLLVSCILITILLKVKWYSGADYSVFTFADATVVFVFLILYMSATVTFCFFISVFFSKANTAGTVAGLAWFLSYAPYIFLQNSYDTISLSTKLASSLASNTAMSYGFQLLLMAEGTGEGVQWDTLFTPVSQDDSLSIGHVMIMLLIDTFVYLIIALYVEAVFPGNFGVPQKWYFPFTRKYWCGNSTTSAISNHSDESNSNTNNEYFEEEPHRLKTGIQIKNLKKSFGSKTAVRGLSVNMYENQITVLLGHNGAGKTTTMSMLTGMFPPTSGTAMVGGHDITTNIDSVRDSLGLCPQHNILFDDLTVREHLYFFGKLKGLSGNEIETEIKKYINLLKLEDKEKAKSSTLSGGMKRKLSVGVALCGNSKVVMLDEPTAGMDPSARRAVWDLLQSQKEGRTMLLTTHFMDEADLLGDRIAIMAGGELQCCGSSFFLKKKYGAGYHLIVDKASGCDSTKVTSFLKNHISSIQVENDIGSELTYLLTESQSAQFEGMLSSLENNTENLRIRSYGISLTTLEEVFLKVGADHGQEEMYNDKNGNHTNTNYKESNQKQNGYNYNGEILETSLKMGDEQFLLTDYKLIVNQFRAMFMKRLLSIKRSWILQTIQFLMPLVYILIALLVNQTEPPMLPSLTLTLDSYENPITLISGDTNSAYFENYKKLLGDRKQEIVENMTTTMIDYTRDNAPMVRKQYMVGAEFNENNIVAYFNNDPYHTPPLALGLALNAKLGTNFTFVNYPLPFTYESQFNQLTTPNNLGFQIAFNMGFSMAFVSSFYILFYIRERASKSKHLQFVSGIKVLIFWITSLICDFLTFILTALLLVLTLVCFQEDGFSTFYDIARTFATLMYFAWAMLPMMYIASHFFEKPASGYTRMTLFSVFTGNAAFLTVQILNMDGLDLQNVGNPLHWVFLIIPHYSFISGLMEAYKMRLLNIACEPLNYQNTICVGVDDQYFKWEAPGIGRNLFFSLMVGAILFTILLLKDFKLLKFIEEFLNRYTKKSPPPIEEEDEDVSAEKQRIRSTSQQTLLNDNILVLRDVTKYYKNFLAVNTLCLGAKDHECFGLLGINGAGKTTTFKMMTGDVSISSGDAWVKGFSLKTNLAQVQKLIGYCPQFDALLDDMTARETLTMFALIRGVPQNECRALGDKLAKDFDFERHLDKKVKELSGGNKRKLSTSIALIGDPPVIYLDEPTTGMDPATKRYLWNAICKVRDNGKCIVLTSHSMEECEALCTRLAIMVNGKFKCIGSTQHLKNKFAEGYSLIIKVRKSMDSSSSEHSDTTKIENFVRQKFPGSQLREKHQEYLNYYITDKNVPWSKMFGIMELAKRSDLNIEDYSLGQCSLEQVFLSFTKLQTDADA